MSQIDAFPEIPSKKKPRNKPVSALEKVKNKLGSFGYLEEVQNPHFSYTKKNWIAVGVCKNVFPYKKKELGRGETIELALKMAQNSK